MSFLNFFDRFNKKKLDDSLLKTKQNFFSKLSRIFVGKSRINSEILDQIEELLISSDIGIKTTIKIIDELETRVKKEKYLNSDELSLMLKNIISNLLKDTPPINIPSTKPYVILVVGVNGVGKTTTIAKLANMYKKKGFSVALAAGDTYRAAAIEQLEIWTKRINIPLIKRSMGSDPASVIYDSISYSKDNKVDFLIIDTAGRLHNKINLMNELEKISNVIEKKLSYKANEVLLVLDATTGQNAVNQAREFISKTNVNNIVLTKIDGTAKGGIVISVSDQFNIPIKYLCLGEKIDDIQLFNKDEFVDSLLK